MKIPALVYRWSPFLTTIIFSSFYHFLFRNVNYVYKRNSFISFVSSCRQDKQRHRQMTWVVKSFCSSKSAVKPRTKLLLPNLLPISIVRKPFFFIYLLVWFHFIACHRYQKCQLVFGKQTVVISSASNFSDPNILADQPNKLETLTLLQKMNYCVFL